MRVLIFSQHFWPEAFRINAVARALHEAGHEVHVLTGQPNYPDGQVFPGYHARSTGTEDWAGITIHRVPLVPRGGASALRLVANYLSFIASSATVGAWRLRRQPIDAVLVYATSPLLQAIGAWVVARSRRAALVTWVQDLWPQSLEVTGYVRSRRMLAAVARVVRWIYARQDMVLVPSRAFAPAVRALAPADLRIEYLPNPGDDEAGADAPPALTLGPAFNVVFTGNLGTAQALDTVIDAAEALRDRPDIRFVLVGSGQRGDWLHRQVRERGLANVTLPGRVAPAEIPAILAQASATLVTLRRDPAMALTVPSKLQTYLAAGRPIIAALDGEGARIVEEAGAGLACAAEDAPALAAAVRELAGRPPSERTRMGEAARRCFERDFAWAAFTPTLVARLNEAAEAQRR